MIKGAILELGPWNPLLKGPGDESKFSFIEFKFSKYLDGWVLECSIEQMEFSNFWRLDIYCAKQTRNDQSKSDFQSNTEVLIRRCPIFNDVFLISDNTYLPRERPKGR